MKKKEEIFNNLFDKCNINIFSDTKFNRIIILNKNNNWLVDYNKESNYTNISDELIWSIFEKEQKMSEDEIKNFIRLMLLIHFKIRRTVLISPLSMI